MLLSDFCELYQLLVWLELYSNLVTLVDLDQST